MASGSLTTTNLFLQTENLIESGAGNLSPSKMSDDRGRLGQIAQGLFESGWQSAYNCKLSLKRKVPTTGGKATDSVSRCLELLASEFDWQLFSQIRDELLNFPEVLACLKNRLYASWFFEGLSKSKYSADVFSDEKLQLSLKNCTSGGLEEFERRILKDFSFVGLSRGAIVKIISKICIDDLTRLVQDSSKVNKVNILLFSTCQPPSTMLTMMSAQSSVLEASLNVLKEKKRAGNPKQLWISPASDIAQRPPLQQVLSAYIEAVLCSACPSHLILVVIGRILTLTFVLPMERDAKVQRPARFFH